MCDDSRAHAAMQNMIVSLCCILIGPERLRDEY